MSRAHRRPLSVHRFFVSAESLAHAVKGGTVVLRDGEARHAAVVLRLRAGDRIVVFDGSGVEHVVRLSAVAPEQAIGEIVETRPGTVPRTRVVLLQGVPKGTKMDDIIRMGTELGVGEFIPILTRRAVGQARGRVERWRRIAAAAAKQSRRADVPGVRDPQALADALQGLPSEAMLLVLWEGERIRSIRDVLAGASPPPVVALLVGPEGGLEEAEVALAVQRGGIPVTLGPLVLRTETAGAAALAAVLYEFGLRE